MIKQRNIFLHFVLVDALIEYYQLQYQRYLRSTIQVSIQLNNIQLFTMHVSKGIRKGRISSTPSFRRGRKRRDG